MEDPLKQQKARANRYKKPEPEACFVIKLGHFEGHEPVFLFPVPSHLMHFTAHKKIHTMQYNLMKSRYNPRRKELKRSCSYDYTHSKALYKRLEHSKYSGKNRNLLGSWFQYSALGLSTVCYVNSTSQLKTQVKSVQIFARPLTDKRAWKLSSTLQEASIVAYQQKLQKAYS